MESSTRKRFVAVPGALYNDLHYMEPPGATLDAPTNDIECGDELYRILVQPIFDDTAKAQA